MTTTLQTDSKVRSTNNRMQWISISRGIGIILVLIGHFYSSTRTPIYTFHMPLFFFLSGFVFHPSTKISHSIIRNAKKLLIPYLCTSAFIIAVSSALSVLKGTFSVSVLWNSILRCFFGIAGDEVRSNPLNVPMIGSLWFLQALFWGRVFTDSILKISKSKYKEYIIILVLCVISYISSKYIWLPMNIQSGMFNTLFVVAGYHAKAYNDNKNTGGGIYKELLCCCRIAGY